MEVVGARRRIARGVGVELAVRAEIPAVGKGGLLTLTVLVTLAGVAALRRRFGFPGGITAD
jgi:hypothetical protein